MTPTTVSAENTRDHSTFKLGLLPPEPGRVALQVGDYLTGAVPQHPAYVDYLEGTTFGLYQNDRYGVCGPTSVANSRREVSARLKGQMAAPSQEDVFDLYRRSGNPDFNPATGRGDRGVNMQSMLQALNQGGIGGVKCLGFAAVNTRDLEELKAAVAVFGFLLLGVNLQQAQQQQTSRGLWDYTPSPPWGGHAILTGAYKDNLHTITWARRVQLTPVFLRYQLSEAWVVLWPEHLADKGFLAGVDVRALAGDYQALTGRPFPAQIPPPLTPVPPPAGGVLTIDPIAKRIIYPKDWTATPVT